MKKENKRTLKRLLTVFLPVMTGVILIVILPNPVTLIIR
jgi:hypothetical protein